MSSEANGLAVLAIFGCIVVEYSVRTYRRRFQLTGTAIDLWANIWFKAFCAAVVVAYTGIFVRCVYRIPELIEGWGGSLMRKEVDFIVLEGVMIVFTVAAQTIFHPGFFFEPMRAFKR